MRKAAFTVLSVFHPAGAGIPVAYGVGFLFPMGTMAAIVSVIAWTAAHTGIHLVMLHRGWND